MQLPCVLGVLEIAVGMALLEHVVAHTEKGKGLVRSYVPSVLDTKPT